VFGGAYNQVELDNNQLIQQRQAQELQRQQEEANQMKLQEAERQREYEARLAEAFGTEKPKTLGDYYTTAQRVAGESGQADQMLKLVQAQEEEARRRKAELFQTITAGPGLMRAGMEGAFADQLQAIGQDPSRYITPEARDAANKAFKGLDANGDPIFKGAGGGSGRQAIPYTNEADDTQWVDPRDTKRRDALKDAGYKKGEEYKAGGGIEDLARMFGLDVAPKPKIEDLSASQKQTVEATKPPPPPRKPGESFEDYRARVNGK